MKTLDLNLSSWSVLELWKLQFLQSLSDDSDRKWQPLNFPFYLEIYFEIFKIKNGRLL